MPESHSSLDYLFSEDLPPLFWTPKRIALSAWRGHIPFAHWLVHAARPGTFVELGTHMGVSYCAICGAVEKTGIDTRCFAVDTWKGDKHSGFYDEEIFTEFKAFHDKNFGSFSKIIRAEFDSAADQFEERSIDLIHFDGLHTYEAVRHDFETWLPKLSEQAVALFHDTNEKKSDFGVWRFWSELRDKYPSFEFLHSHGLGVLCVGPNAPGKVQALCALDSAEQIAAVRNRFETISLQWSERERLLAAKHDQDQKTAVRSAVAAEEARATSLRDTQAAEHARAIAAREAKLAEQQKKIDADAGKIAADAGRIAADAGRIAADAEKIAADAKQMEAQSQRITALGDEVGKLRRDLEATRNSRSWRITKPLRMAANLLRSKRPR